MFVNHLSSPPAMLLRTMAMPAAQLRERTVSPGYSAEDAHDAVAGHVEHGGGDAAVCFGEAFVFG